MSSARRRPLREHSPDGTPEQLAMWCTANAGHYITEGKYGFPLLLVTPLTLVNALHPPLGHPRRCRGPKMRLLRELREAGRPTVWPDLWQCTGWATGNTRYCRYHGGNTGTHARKKMAQRYLKNAGATLRDIMLRYGKEAPHERHALDDEIDAQRMICERAVLLYEKCVLDPATSATVSEDLKAAASVNLQQQLEKVSELVARAAKVRAISKDLVDVGTLEYIVAQVTDIIDSTIRPVDSDLADDVVARLREIKLPDRSNASPVPGGDADQLRRTIAALDDSVPDA